jgi:hypothetical protein
MTTPTEVPACITRDNLTSPWFPSTRRSVVIASMALGVIFLLTSFHRLNHTDLWGHLNFGRWMAESQALPASDPFSSTPIAQSMLHSAWLSQLIGFEVQNAFGNEGLVFGHALLVTLMAAALMLAVYCRQTDPMLAWLAGPLMFVLSLPVIGTIRPQLFGMLGAALALLACSQLLTKRLPLLWIPVVFAFWANLHGSVLMGLAILGLFALGVTIEAWRDSQNSFAKMFADQRVPRAWTALLLALFASCLNPHGPLLLVRTIFFGEHAALQYISEWRALTPNSLTGVLVILSTIASGLLYKYSPRKWTAYELLLLVAFGLLNLTAIRMLAWWALVCPWVIVPHVAAWVAAWIASQREESNAPPELENDSTAMNTLLVLGLLFMVCIVAPPTYSVLAGRGRGPAENLVTDTPIYVADELTRRDLEGNFFAPMDWSDYLLWQSHGRLRPLVYSHVHLTNQETWDDYVKIITGDPTWLERLQKSGINFVVVSKKRNPELVKRVLQADRSGEGQAWIFYQDQKSLIAEIRPASAKVTPANPAAAPASELPSTVPSQVPTQESAAETPAVSQSSEPLPGTADSRS